jgi:hypothetical protein
VAERRTVAPDVVGSTPTSRPNDATTGRAYELVKGALPHALALTDRPTFDAGGARPSLADVSFCFGGQAYDCKLRFANHQDTAADQRDDR